MIRRAGSRWNAVALALISLGFAAVAQAEPPSCDRPPIAMSRFDEDYAFLANPNCRTDLWDPVKYIALGPDPAYHLSLGFDIRERFEFVRGTDWEPAPDDAYLLQRYMVHADLQLGVHARAFAQLTSNFANDRLGGPRPVDEDALDLHQAFGDVRVDVPDTGPLTIRIGRQEIDYEDARLISIREGANVRLSFDAVRGMQSVGAWRLDAFAAAPVETNPGVFDDGREQGQLLWGVYALGPLSGEAVALDLFYFGFHHRDAVFDQGEAREDRHSFGARISGTPADLDYNFELVYQLGTFGAGTLTAWLVASDTGYTFRSATLRPRLSIQLNAMSGDADPTDPDLQTFNPLFPQASYFSDANLIGPFNLMDVHPMLTLQPIESLTITLHYDAFWRESLADGVYRTSGALIASGQGNRSRFIGSEAALRLHWQADRHAAFVASYSHFFVGSFLRDAGLSHDVDFVAVWLSYRI